LELALADHEGCGHRAGRMILAHDRAFRRSAAHDIDELCAGEMVVGGSLCQPHAIDDRGKAIDKGDRLAADDTRRHLGSGHDHRHAGGLLVHVGFAPQPPRSEVVAMVASVDDARGGGEVIVVERLHESADVVINEADEAEISGGGGSRSIPIGSPTPSTTCSGMCSLVKPLSSSALRKCSLPIESTRWPAALSRWAQEGTLPS